jgi:hypothetical protein
MVSISEFSSLILHYENHSAAISFFLALTFSLNSLLEGLALSRIPQHSQNKFVVIK